MCYRDDLGAAHARIEALEAELARLTAENVTLARRNEELEADAKIGREVRLRNAKHEGFSEERLREKMRREEAEVEAKMRAMREEREAEAKLRAMRERRERGGDSDW